MAFIQTRKYLLGKLNRLHLLKFEHQSSSLNQLKRNFYITASNTKNTLFTNNSKNNNLLKPKQVGELLK